MIIDAKDLILGRLSTIVAKRTLLGEKIDIVNCEKAVISGKRKNILESYIWKRSIGGTAQKGPYTPRRSEKLVKRTIRGMLPYKRERGLKALKNIKCYYGIPQEFKGKEIITIKEANKSRLEDTNYITVGHICNQTGGE